MSRLLATAPLALLLVACAAQPPQPPQAAAAAASDGADMRCEKVYPTGSNMPKTVCTTAEDRRRQQQLVDQMADQIRSGPATPRNPM